MALIAVASSSNPTTAIASAQRMVSGPGSSDGFTRYQWPQIIATVNTPSVSAPANRVSAGPSTPQVGSRTSDASSTSITQPSAAIVAPTALERKDSSSC